MKTSYIIIIVIMVIIFIGVLAFSVTLPMWNTTLVSPNFVKNLIGRSDLSPSPSPRVKTFQFDSTTNLKQELDTVDPRVLDSDFNE